MSPRTYDMSKRRAAVERTRSRILEATMQLHAEQGVLETSWEQIAQRAGVAIGTVYRHFPSLDELVPACGELSMRKLELPDAGRRRELFAAAADPGERLRTLVDACYAIYERGEDVLRATRRERERDALPPVAESHAEIETTVDALVEEALRPLGAGATLTRTTRAICDFDTWRALRRQDLGAEAAVEVATGLLAGALEGR